MALPRPLARLFGPRMIKRWLPTSLFGRSFLIIVLPIAIMQLAVTWLFFVQHENAITARLAEGLAEEIASISHQYQQDPGDLPALVKQAQALDLSVMFKPEDLPRDNRRNFFLSVDQTLSKALREHLGTDQSFWFDTTRYPYQVPIWIKVDGGSLAFIAPKERAFATQGSQFVFYSLITTLLLTAVALLFIRNQVRAIERLANAAEAFGQGGDVSTFKPHGAREVRQAGEAFLAMRANIRRLMASVSHDLRTPLTRLKLELALKDPSERNEGMKRDLAEMEHMIDEYLDFARGAGGEAAEPVRLMDIIDMVAHGARRSGADVSTRGDPDLVAPVKRGALTRAITNLTHNAAAHASRVEIGLTEAGGDVVITVDDNGPGIDPERYEEAFKPFTRLDEARNQNEKGVGLGLAIVRDVARSHGGDVTLSKSPLGGLRAEVWLPVSGKHS